jgi:hypothetical protein
MKWGSLVLLLLVLTLLPLTRAFADDWDPVTDAEKTMASNPLDPGSGAVVLFKRGSMSVLELTSLHWVTTVKTYTRIKILNDAGRDAANVSLDSPKWEHISNIQGRTILPDGRIIPLDSSQVFSGRSFQSGKNFYAVKTSFTFPSVQPGAIVEYQMEAVSDSFFPSPWIFDTPDIGTIASTLHVLVGPRLSISVDPIQTNLSKLEMTRKSNVQGDQLDFTTHDLRPIRTEPYSLPYRDVATRIIFTPATIEFENQDYPIIDKWDDVAQVINNQYTDFSKVSKQAHDKAREVAGSLPDGRPRAEAIYQYLQQNITSTHLLGVGLYGSADEIIANKRADPDTLNALFVSMLKEVKVDADLVLVTASNWDQLIADFPNFAQFSRAIVRINFKDGPVFADASEAGAPFGELPWYEHDIVGLVVKGSKIQQTKIPAGTADNNLSETKISVKIASDWKAEADAETDLKGAEAIELRENLLAESGEDLDKQLTDYFAFGHSDATVSSVVHPDLKDSSQPLVLKGHVSETLVDRTGPGQLLLNPWLDDRYDFPVFKATQRFSAVLFDSPEKRVSTSTWELPLDIKAAQLPKDESITAAFGTFTHSCTETGATVTCTRTYILKQNYLPTMQDYVDAKKFFDEIAKDDQEVLVLQKQ